jgi:hypothetical protein
MLIFIMGESQIFINDIAQVTTNMNNITTARISAMAFAAVMIASAISLVSGNEAFAERPNRQVASNQAQNAFAQANVQAQVPIDVKDVNVNACVIVGTCDPRN